mgnify:CR=1 FL=1
MEMHFVIESMDLEIMETHIYHSIRAHFFRIFHHALLRDASGFFHHLCVPPQLEKWSIDAEALEEARRFGYARYDSFENYDCVSLEMQDFEDVLSAP